MGFNGLDFFCAMLLGGWILLTANIFDSLSFKANITPQEIVPELFKGQLDNGSKDKNNRNIPK